MSDVLLRSRTILSICSDIFSQYRRCAFLKEHGWLVLGSSSGHGGIVQFAAELVDVVVLDVEGDGAEMAVIAGELKRTKGKVPVIMLVGKSQTLIEGVVECADAVVPRLDAELLKALEARVGQPAHAAVLGPVATRRFGVASTTCASPSLSASAWASVQID